MLYLTFYKFKLYDLLHSVGFSCPNDILPLCFVPVPMHIFLKECKIFAAFIPSYIFLKQHMISISKVFCLQLGFLNRDCL
jgi:hypothetical protein